VRELNNKVAVVTGAASGIGRALAHSFAGEGMRVVIADIDVEQLQASKQELLNVGAQVLAVKTDVSKSDDVDTLARETLAAFGGIHVVCNNAGVGTGMGPVWERSITDWEWVLGVNLWGVIHGIRTFVPILLRQGEPAHVVNTASIAGLLAYPFPFMGIYNASKHAIVALSETLSSELAVLKAPVNVSVVCPGAVRTRIMDAERNRPHLSTGHPPNPAFAQAEETLRSIIDAGTSPQVIAPLVVSAIRENRLYVFPHPEYGEALRSRADDIISERNPIPTNV
jgi:NAD(P)-dependent dehydrogenase (short-subunit alcohol dehydrogenase family)